MLDKMFARDGCLARLASLVSFGVTTMMRLIIIIMTGPEIKLRNLENVDELV